MSKGKMNLQQFADRHGLQVKDEFIQGPHGQLYQNALRGFVIWREFNPVTQAKMAIEAIGLQYTAPPEPIKKDRRAFLIVERTDGWYVADKAGPFMKREAARTVRERLKTNR